MAKNQMTVLKKVLHRVKPYSAALVFSLLLAIVQVAMTLYIPILVGNAIDCIIDVGRVDFETLLKSRQYKKVYVMLGINELGYGRDATAAKYGKLLELIKEYQPESIIFVEANLHVSKERSDTDSVFNNRRIDEYNEKISQFADNESVFYIDVNPVFDDGDGNLADKYTSDHSHILAKYYENWREWLKTKAVLM